MMICQWLPNTHQPVNVKEVNDLKSMNLYQLGTSSKPAFGAFEDGPVLGQVCWYLVPNFNIGYEK